MTITEKELAEWERLADEATEGPLIPYHMEGYGWTIASPDRPAICAGEWNEADADFFAASRTAVPALCAALRQSRKERDEAVDALGADIVKRDAAVAVKIKEIAYRIAAAEHERDEARRERDEARREHLSDVERLTAKYGEATDRAEGATKERDEADEALRRLLTSVATLTEKHETLAVDYNRLSQACTDLSVDRIRLMRGLDEALALLREAKPYVAVGATPSWDPPRSAVVLLARIDALLGTVKP